MFKDKSPAERNKLIVAMVLGAIAVFAVGYLLIGGSGTPTRVANTNRHVTQSKTISSTGPQSVQPTVDQIRNDSNEPPQPLDVSFRPPSDGDVGRNIFAYYEPPPKPSPTPKIEVPVAPSPTPTPPFLITSMTPQMIYARTPEVNLQINGDKFVPSAQIYINDAQIPTRFLSSVQLAAKVPTAMIASEGQRIVKVSTPDGKLYSNQVTLQVQAPPLPNVTYIGIIGTKRYIDTAILEDKGSKAQLSVQRGDTVGGRFRVASISEKEITLIDNTLKIRHTVPMTGDNSRNTGYQSQPMQRMPDADDDGNP